MKVLVTGGTGFIGKRLVDRLLESGYSVSVLTRKSAGQYSSDVDWIVGDLASDQEMNKIDMASYDVVFHCAGEINNIAIMRNLHVEGTRRLLRAVNNSLSIRKRSIHWVQLSSVGAYGPSKEGASLIRIVTENTTEDPTGEYEVTKTEADRLVIQNCEKGFMTYSIVRPSNVFGADMPNQSLRSLTAIVRRGLFFYIGRSGAVATYVHVDDVVEVLMLCGADPRAKGEIFNISNDCLLKDMIEGLAFALKARKPWLRLPEPLVRAGVFCLDKFISLPITQARIDALVSKTQYPNDKIKNVLNYVPRISVPKAMGEIVEKA